MPRAPWYEESPERLDWELQRFADFGIAAETDIENGILEMRCEADLQGSVVPVRIMFPIDYPDKAPELYGPEETLSRHQGLSGNFCVLEDPQNDWSPERSAAELVG